MTPAEKFRQLLELGEAWRVLDAWLEANSSTFLLTVDGAAALWPGGRNRARTAVTCHDPVEPSQWRHLNVSNKECVIVCALPQNAVAMTGRYTV
jgi:hypothetical protein